MPLRLLNSNEVGQLLDGGGATSAAERAIRSMAAHRWHPEGSETAQFNGSLLRTSLAFEDESGIIMRFERATLHPDRPVEPRHVGTERSLATLYRPAASPIAHIPLRPILLMQAAALAALATRLLANENASCLGVIGTGEQARMHIRSILRVRNIKRILLAGRTSAKCQAFTAEIASTLGGGMSIEAADVGRVASLADIICVCTDSRTPVLLGNEVRRGAHINAIGATTFDSREVDTNTVLRSKVVIEDKEMGITSAGDLRIPVEEGRLSAEALQTDLWDVLLGKKVVRTSPEDITLFKAVGHPAVEFYLALAAYEAAVERRIGTEVDF